MLRIMPAPIISPLHLTTSTTTPKDVSLFWDLLCPQANDQYLLQWSLISYKRCIILHELKLNGYKWN